LPFFCYCGSRRNTSFLNKENKEIGMQLLSAEESADEHRVTPGHESHDGQFVAVGNGEGQAGSTVLTWKQALEQVPEHSRQQKPALCHPELGLEEQTHNAFIQEFVRASPRITFEEKMELINNPNKLREWANKLREVAGVGKSKLTPHEMRMQDVRINVDRTRPFEYGVYVYREDELVEPVHPELENEGPSEYWLSSVVPWFHPDQTGNSLMSGPELHQYYVESGLIKRCLGYRDGLELKKLPVEVFRQHFPYKILYLRRSAVKLPDGTFVPYVCDAGDRIEVRWVATDKEVLATTPTALFEELGFKLVPVQ
jgi:hypothetical protein